MTPEQALELVIFEGTNIEGMVVGVRSCDDPGPERVQKLYQALLIVERSLQGESSLDRNLANALNGLTFHMSASLEGWQNCDWINDYVRILAVIESIFDGIPYEAEE